MSNKKWFDKECRFKKMSLESFQTKRKKTLKCKFTREKLDCFNGIQKVVVQKRTEY